MEVKPVAPPPAVELTIRPPINIDVALSAYKDAETVSDTPTRQKAEPQKIILHRNTATEDGRIDTYA